MPDRSRRPRPRYKRLDGRASDSPAASDRPVEAPPEASPPLGDDFVRRPASLDLWLLSAAGLVLLGFALRAFSLGNQPLSPSESANALQSLAYYRGEGVDASAGPLFVYGEALIFLLFGASDSSARLLSAIAPCSRSCRACRYR